MSERDYTTVRNLKLHEIGASERNKHLVRQYANAYCVGYIRKSLLKLAA